MLRRTFLNTAFTIAISAPIAAFATSALAADNFTNYKTGAIKAALAKGQTVFVDYAATWCTTCRAQERVINTLIQENPDYKNKMAFFRVDWDEFGSEPVSTDRNIPRRSTLLVLKGDNELGRIVAGTSKSAIKELMDKGI